MPAYNSLILIRNDNDMIDRPQVTIREASRDDLPRLVELMKSLVITTSDIESQGASTLADYEPVVDEILRAPRHWIYVAEVDGQVVGSADFLIMPNLSHRGTPWAVIDSFLSKDIMAKIKPDEPEIEGILLSQVS